MNVYYLLLLAAIRISSLALSEGHRHDHGHRHHIRQRISATGGELRLHGNEDDSTQGRGFFNPFKAMAQTFTKLIKGNSHATIKGPIEDSKLYKSALEIKMFAEIAKNWSVCQEEPQHMTQKMVQAAIDCKDDAKSYTCFITCLYEGIGIVKSEKLNDNGLSDYVAAFFKEQSGAVRKGVKSTFYSCFEDGTRLMLAGTKCSKNKKIVYCIKESLDKICNRDKEEDSSESLLRKGKHNKNEKKGKKGHASKKVETEEESTSEESD